MLTSTSRSSTVTEDTDVASRAAGRNAGGRSVPAAAQTASNPGPLRPSIRSSKYPLSRTQAKAASDSDGGDSARQPRRRGSQPATELASLPMSPGPAAEPASEPRELPGPKVGAGLE